MLILRRAFLKVLLAVLPLVSLLPKRKSEVGYYIDSKYTRPASKVSHYHWRWCEDTISWTEGDLTQLYSEASERPGSTVELRYKGVSVPYRKSLA